MTYMSTLGGKMNIWNDILSIIVSNGIFAILFVWLFWYQLRDSAKREERYQETIGQLTAHLKILEDVKQDLTDIKEYLKNGESDEEIF